MRGGIAAGREGGEHDTSLGVCDDRRLDFSLPSIPPMRAGFACATGLVCNFFSLVIDEWARAGKEKGLKRLRGMQMGELLSLFLFRTDSLYAQIQVGGAVLASTSYIHNSSFKKT